MPVHRSRSVLRHHPTDGLGPFSPPPRSAVQDAQRGEAGPLNSLERDEPWGSTAGRGSAVWTTTAHRYGVKRSWETTWTLNSLPEAGFSRSPGQRAAQWTGRRWSAGKCLGNKGSWEFIRGTYNRTEGKPQIRLTAEGAAAINAHREEAPRVASSGCLLLRRRTRRSLPNEIQQEKPG